MRDVFSEPDEPKDDEPLEEHTELEESDDFGALTGDQIEDSEEPSALELDRGNGAVEEAPKEVESVDDVDPANPDDNSVSDELELERFAPEVIPLEDSLDDANGESDVEPDIVADDEDEEVELDRAYTRKVIEGEFERTEVEEPVEVVQEEGAVAEAGTLERLPGATWVLVPVVLFGMVLRVLWYWKSPALWLDEAAITSEVLWRSFGALFEPIGENQSAPIGFLLAVKSSIAVFGDSEIGLRLVPMLATLLALVFMAWTARRILDSSAALIAVGLLSVSWPVIRYSGELKQYSTDVLASALMLGMGAMMLSEYPTRRRLVLFGLAGAIIQWFSLPVLFTLAGVGLVAGVKALLQRDKKYIGGLLLVALAWLGSFTGHYILSLRHYAQNENFQNWHYDAFFLTPPDRGWVSSIKWLVWTFTDMFADPVGLVLPGLGVLGFLAGVVVLGRKRPSVLAMLLLPMFVVLSASYLHRYPLFGRFLQFLVPAVLLVTAAGLGELTRLLWKFNRVMAVILIALVFVQPLVVAVNKLAKPVDTGIRPLVAYLEEHISEADDIYLHYWIRNEFKYYTRDIDALNYEEVEVGITSRRDWSYYEAEIRDYAGSSNVWFVLQDNDLHVLQGERQFFETRLDALGVRLEHRVWKDYHLYAYDLSGLETLPDMEEVTEGVSFESEAGSPGTETGLITNVESAESE